MAEAFLALYVQPGASKTEICGRHNGYIKIRLKAPPVEGKANEALIDFLAKRLNLKKAELEIVSGYQSRYKKVKIMKNSTDFYHLLLLDE